MRIRRTGVVAGIVACAVVLSGPSAAVAVESPPEPSEPAPLTLTIDGPADAHIQTDSTLTVTARDGDGDGEPVPALDVVVQRHDPETGDWSTVGEYVLDEGGTAVHTFRVRPGDNGFRARFDGDEEYAAAVSEVVLVQGRRIVTVLTLSGRGRVVDERRTTIHIAWQAADGRPVTGRVRLYRKVQGTRDWELVRRPRVVDGAASVSVRPRVDTIWRAHGLRGLWFRSDRSGWYRLDNVPPARPVILPADSPQPSIDLPEQRRGFGAGLNPRVMRIPDRVWRSMVGRSWHRGCPVGRSRLRLVRMNYWGYDGYRHRGELVVRGYEAPRVVGTFRELYRGRYPIRHMYRVDRFGWSKHLQGADDYRSMRAGNTSAFNCREVVGRPGVQSPHTYGRSIDLNPWENPYVTHDGTYPNSWWLSRSRPRYAWRSSDHPVVRAFSAHGFSWGGSYRDYHHFQG